MKGILFALLGGAFIAVQGAANTRISEDLGTWQTAALTQCTGFILAFAILLIVRDQNWKMIKQVKPLYLSGGTFGAGVIFSNVTAILQNGAALTISASLIAQLCLTFLIDSNGWFGVARQQMRLQHLLGIGMMIAGVMFLRF